MKSSKIITSDLKISRNLPALRPGSSFKPRFLSKYDYYYRLDHQSETSEILDTIKSNNDSDKFTNIGRNLVKGVTCKSRV